MKKLWKFKWDSDYAFIGGLFVATDEEVQSLIGKEIYIGEYEGKYSDVYGTVEEDEITLKQTLTSLYTLWHGLRAKGE